MAHQQKGLRVSGIPEGSQRSSYFLSLPYRVGVPLVALSALLHWLVSQTMFVIAIERRGPFGGPANLDPFVCGDSCRASEPGKVNIHLSAGWSPMALVGTIFFFGIMTLLALAAGLKRYSPGPPLGCGNSAVLAAACHLTSDEDGFEVARAKIKWGVVREPFDDVAGHCSLSARPDITSPQDGQKYE